MNLPRINHVRMARLFSIYFEYLGVPYTAMISVRTTPFFNEYVLNHFDDSLIKMLPGNKIISTPSGSLQFMPSCEMESTPLMKAILRAVSSHLQSSEV